jgi:hypothetical protein
MCGWLFISVVYFVHCRHFSIGGNVLALGEEADFEALNCQPALSLIRSTKLHLSTEPAFLPNACYLLGFFRSLAVCPCLLLPCCFGLVALLDFLALVCALKKYKCATKCVGLC